MFEDVFSRRNLILKKIIRYFYDDFNDIILESEVFSLSLFYEKCYYNIYYQINENNYLKCKKKIYQLYEKDTKSRYYYHRNLVMVKKGKSEVVLNLQEVIYNILKNRGVESSVKKYIFKFHRTEYQIISDYLKYQKRIYF